MKFAKSLLRNQVPEWTTSYVDYKSLKKLIRQAAQAQNPNDATAPFFYALDRNVELVDHFYNSKHAEYSRRLRYLSDKFHSISAQNLEEDELDDLIGILMELRAQFRKLQWYADINKRGFAKILKKFDKKIGTHTQTRYLTSKILILAFANEKPIAEELALINKFLKQLAPSQSANGTEDLLNGLQRKTRSNSMESMDESLCEFYKAVDEGDPVQLQSLFSKHLLSPKSLSNLLVRTLSSKSTKCIPTVLEHCNTLEDSNDINARTLLHRFIIQRGRSTESTNIVGAVYDHTSQNGSKRDGVHASNAEDNFGPVVRCLLEHLKPAERKALVTTDHQLRTPLHYSCRFGLTEITRQLMLFLTEWKLLGADGVFGPEWYDSEGMTPVDLAIIHNHSAATAVVLELNGPPETNHLDPLLLTAARLNSTATLQVLLDFDCSIDYRDPQTGETALYITAKYGFEDSSQLLIDRGADLEIAENTYGWTPLFVTAVDGTINIARALINAGAVTTRTDTSGWTAKEHAALRGHIALSKLLPFAPYVENSSNASTAPTPERVESPAPVNSENGSLQRRNARTDVELLKTFGHRYIQDSKKTMILVTLGWKDVRKTTSPISLDSVPLTQAGQTELDTALSLVVSASHCTGEPLISDLPIADDSTEQVTFFTEDVSSVQLYFDLVPTYGSSTKVLGRAVALLGNVIKKVGNSHYNLNDDITLPIIESKTLKYLGTVTFGFLLVTSFSHPKIGIEKSQTYWKSLISTRVIGHRGLGKNTLSTGSLQLGENTIESFVQAANLGASYVEFDVQLTKDHVPVIYHDFIVSETGLDIPMHHLTLEQFMGMNESSGGILQAVDDTEVVSKKRANRSKSMGQVKLIDDNDFVPNRIKLTQDYRSKGVKGNIRGHSIHSNFATLEELFQKLPENVGFNIECKYPMLDECEAENFDGVVIDINKWVDTVLDCVYTFKGERDIIFSSFNPDICVLLSMKQPSIPVLFLTEAGTTPMYDFRASSLQEAIRFAHHWNLLGIVAESTPLVDCPRLVQAVKSSGLVCFTYGALNNTPEYARRQLKAGVDAVIVDSVLAVRKELTLEEAP